MTSQSTTECPHCGAALKARTSLLCGRPVFCGFEPCGCDGAAAEREREEAARAEAARAESEARRRRAYEAAGVRPRFMAPLPPALAGLAGRALEAVERGRGAYLHGGVGAGKSSVASWVAMRCVDSGMRVRVASAAGIVDGFYAAFSGGDANEVLRRLCDCDVLVIDDLGKEPASGRPVSQVYRVVNEVYERLGSLVVTSQLTRGQLVSRAPDGADRECAMATASRLRQMCDLIEFPSGDWRRR